MAAKWEFNCSAAGERQPSTSVYSSCRAFRDRAAGCRWRFRFGDEQEQSGETRVRQTTLYLRLLTTWCSSGSASLQELYLCHARGSDCGGSHKQTSSRIKIREVARADCQARRSFCVALTISATGSGPPRVKCGRYSKISECLSSPVLKAL